MGSGNIGALLGVHCVLRKKPRRGLGGEGVDKRQPHNMYVGGRKCVYLLKKSGDPHLQVGKIGAPCPQEGGREGEGDKKQPQNVCG